jgi:hypothetical protein
VKFCWPLLITPALSPGKGRSQAETNELPMFATPDGSHRSGEGRGHGRRVYYDLKIALVIQ